MRALMIAAAILIAGGAITTARAESRNGDPSASSAVGCACGADEKSDRYDADQYGRGREAPGYQGPDGYGLDPGGEDEGDTDAAGDAPYEPRDRELDRPAPDTGNPPYDGAEQDSDAPEPTDF